MPEPVSGETKQDSALRSFSSRPTANSSIVKSCSGSCGKAQNQAQRGELFRASHLEPGLVRYEEFVNPITSKKGMTLLVEREAIEEMRESFAGRPVYDISHPNFEVSPQDVPTGKAVGITISPSFIGDDTRDWVKFAVWDSEAVEHCKNGEYAVSCSYYPVLDVTPGVYHNMPYDARVVGGEYEHLAIVKNPRYEASRILRNSKGGNKMFDKIGEKLKLLFKNEGVDHAVEVDKTSKVKLGDAEVTIENLLLAHNALEAAKATDEALKNVTDETILSIEGKTISYGQLKADYLKFQNSVKPALVKEPEAPVVPVKEPVPPVLTPALENAAREDKAKKEAAQNALALADAERGGNVAALTNSAPITKVERLEVGKKFV